MKPSVRYISIYDICGIYPFGRTISDSGTQSGEHFRKSLIKALESSCDIVCMDMVLPLIPGASWIDEVFGKLDNVQKGLVQTKLYVRIDYQFIVCGIENFLGCKLIKHYEIQKELEECKSLKKNSTSILSRILKKMFK